MKKFILLNKISFHYIIKLRFRNIQNLSVYAILQVVLLEN